MFYGGIFCVNLSYFSLCVTVVIVVCSGEVCCCVLRW